MRKPKRKVLSAKELKILMNLPTTVEEAQTIKRRFEAILKALKRLPVTTGDHDMGQFVIYEPCPHCVYNPIDHSYCCGKCRYNSTPFTDSAFANMRCLDTAFGGITARKVTKIVALSYRKATVFGLGPVSTLGIKEELVSKARIWAKGHVEWADAVIKVGGIHEQ